MLSFFFFFLEGCQNTSTKHAQWMTTGCIPQFILFNLNLHWHSNFRHTVYQRTFFLFLYLKKLYCLPIKLRIQHKVLTLMYKNLILCLIKSSKRQLCTILNVN